MSIGESMSNAWHNHPYLIMGVGGVIVLYFLWPSSSSSNSSTTSSGTSSSDYQSQLAAEASLSQSQLADQTAAAINQQNDTATQIAYADQLAAAQASATGSADATIAEANAAAQVSSNQTAQTIATSNADITIAQTQASSTDFQALVSGLTSFGSQSAAVQTNPIDTFLTSIGSSSTGSGSGGSGSTGLASIIGADNGATNTSGELNSLVMLLEGQNGTTSSSGYVPGPWGQIAETTSATVGTSGSSGSGSSSGTFNSDLLGSLWGKLIANQATQAASIANSVPAIALPTLTSTQQSLLPINTTAPTTTTGS
jgi:hypothetical protein